MNQMYFVDEQHELNYQTILMLWPHAMRDVEYKAPVYILSIPMIFEKVEDYMDDFETPVDWIWRYLKWDEQYKKEWERYEGAHEDALHPDHDAWIDRKPYDLTYSAKQLGRLALNLWTSYDDFNLMKCLGSLDDKNLYAARCAIDIRVGIVR